MAVFSFVVEITFLCMQGLHIIFLENSDEKIKS